jgi:hypothetical protein
MDRLSSWVDATVPLPHGTVIARESGRPSTPVHFGSSTESAINVWGVLGAPLSRGMTPP